MDTYGNVCERARRQLEPDNGQVNLNHNDVGNRDDNLGVRPDMRVAYKYC